MIVSSMTQSVPPELRGGGWREKRTFKRTSWGVLGGGGARECASIGSAGGEVARTCLVGVGKKNLAPRSGLDFPEFSKRRFLEFSKNTFFECRKFLGLPYTPFVRGTYFGVFYKKHLGGGTVTPRASYIRFPSSKPFIISGIFRRECRKSVSKKTSYIRFVLSEAPQKIECRKFFPKWASYIRGAFFGISCH